MPEDSKIRQVTKSLTGVLPDSIGVPVEDKLARMLAALQSQVYSRDPDTGELYLGGWQALKDDWKAMQNERKGKIGENKPPTPRRKGHPGIVDETLSLPALATMLPGVKEESIPDWAFDAADNADMMHKTANANAGLAPAKGFAQNAAEGVGTMLGQLPIPVARLRALKAAAPIAEGAPKVVQGAKKVLGSLPEWFSPTVDPSMANYVSGAGAGGALGAYADYKEEQAEEAKAAHRGAQMLVNNYFDKGSMLPGFAEGGRVKALAELVQKLSKPQGGIHFIKNTLGKEVPVLVSPSTPEEAGRFRAIARENFPHDRYYRTWEGNDVCYAFPASGGLHEHMLKPLEQHFGDNSISMGMGITHDELIDQLKKDSKFTGHESVFDPDDPDSGYAEGGKVGALHQVLRVMSMNPSASLKLKKNMLEDPIDNFLYAARQANMSEEEIVPLLAQLKKAQETNKVDPKLAERLVTLHSKLFPVPDDLHVDMPLPPNPKPMDAPGQGGHGMLPARPWDELLKNQPAPTGTLTPEGGDVQGGIRSKLLDLRSSRKAEGGKITSILGKLKARGFYKNPDIDVPPGFARFEVQPTGRTGTVAQIIGVREDGSKKIISTADARLADILARAYNMNGMTDQPIQRLSLSDVFSDIDDKPME